MRVLASSTSGSGHWRPLLPVLAALRDAGHEVRLCVPSSTADSIALDGIEVIAFADADFPSPEQAELLARAEREDDPMLMEHMIGLGFSYYSPRAAMPILRPTFEQFRPDLVVADPAEYGARALARLHGTPVAITHNGQAAAMTHYDTVTAEGQLRLDRELGVAPDATTPTVLVTRTPASFEAGDPGRWGPTPTLRHRSGPPPTAIPDGDPRVYATLGTAAMRTPWGRPTLDLLLEGLADVDAAATITVGEVPTDLPPVPSNVELLGFADHDEVIPAARVVVTHGGAGTIADANEHGRPMVVLPLFADQFHNAAAVDAAGVGQSLVGDAQTPQALAAAVTAAIDGRHREGVDRLAREVGAMPTTAEVAVELVGFATEAAG